MTNSNGNVLFLILIAVALFAALSYAVTNSSRSSGGNAASEAAEVGAARMVSFMAKLDTAVMRIILSKGVQVNEIIYSTPTYIFTDGSIKVSTPPQSSNPDIALFNASNNGVVPETFYDLRDKSIVSAPSPSLTTAGHIGFSWRSVPNLGTTNAEAIVTIIGISPETCLKINQKFGIPTIPRLTSSMAGVNLPNSSGNPGALPFTFSASDLALIAGKYDFCMKYSSPDERNAYNHVLKVF